MTTIPRHQSADAAASADISAHQLSIPDAFIRFESGADGLDSQEVQRRLKRFGLNRLKTVRSESAIKILISQFRSVVVVLLLLATGIALVSGEELEAGAIGVVLLLNAAIGFATEYRARNAMSALLALEMPRAVVVRQGHLRTIEAQTLVPGDVVVLTRGQHVPADGRVIEGSDLRIIEGALTGESVPVSKNAGVLLADTALADRKNMVYRGTQVAAGTARVLITSTGMQTEIGRIGTLTAAVRSEPYPLERRLDELGRRLVWLALGVGLLIAVLGILQGTSVPLVIRTGIALAVAAVPEALPAVATIALAVGVRRMAARRALVRRLAAVEALGSTTVICTDKTRTLTSGAMTVGLVWADGEEFILREGERDVQNPRMVTALAAAAFASQPQSSHADGGTPAATDPIDAAILRAAASSGIDPDLLARDRPRLALLPFSSERKLMASFHRVGNATVAYVKGAPHDILKLSARAGDGGMLDDAQRVALEAVNEQLARRGLRVLGVASGPVAACDASALNGLTFVGFIGLIDPPAAGVRETIGRLQAAGLRIVMLTGDQRWTAEAVGREIGLLSDDATVFGPHDIDAMSAEALQQEVAHIAAFSRITPAHKLAIVRALQARGEVVAMIGDGINDAAALKQADVGVAMGVRGTDVAKEAASIVLQDDSLETVAAAVEEGRVIFDNIRKFVFYLFSCNVGEVLTVCGASLASLPLPVTPLQLLWLNMVTDTFPAFALATEPGDADIMKRPPRDPHQALLSAQFLRSIAWYGVLIMSVTLAAYVWSLRTAPARAVSVAFTTLALAQIFHLGNARSSEPVLSLGRAVRNRHALAAVGVTLALHLAALYVPPLAAILHVEPLQVHEWSVVLPLSLIPAVVGQGLKVSRVLYHALE